MKQKVISEEEWCIKTGKHRATYYRQKKKGKITLEVEKQKIHKKCKKWCMKTGKHRATYYRQKYPKKIEILC